MSEIKIFQLPVSDEVGVYNAEYAVFGTGGQIALLQKHRFTTPLRSITVRAIDLVPEDTPQQLNLFAGYDKQDDIVRLESAVDRLRERFGNKIVVPASLMEKSCRPTLSTDFPKMPAPMYH